MKKQVLTVLVVMLTVIAFIVVANAAEKEKYSGFLKDYSSLKPGPKGGAKLRYLKDGVDFGKYNKVMLDQVVFFLKKDAENKGIQAKEIQDITQAFHEAVAKALEGGYPIVSEPGPDVMRVRVAITNIEPSNPAVSGVTTVMPIGLALSFVKKGVTGKHTGVGSAGMEAEILDSVSSDFIGAAVDDRSGSKASGLTKFGPAKEAFEFWAKRLRTFLDEAHGKNK